MNHRIPLPALALGFLLAVSAQGQHHTVVGNDYDDRPGGGDPNPSANCAGVQAKITISGGVAFSPATVTVDPGQPVCWTWSGGSEHTVKGDDGSFTSGPPSTSGTFQRTFNAPGTYGYYCQVHGTTTSGMRGTVVVRGSSGGSGAGTLALLSDSYTADEGIGALTLTVTRTGGSDGAASVKFETSSGSARKRDFTARKGTLSWAAGDQAAKTFEVPIKNDKAREKNETFTVKLSQATGAGLGTSTATVTINDDDTPGGCGAALAAPAQLEARGLSDSEVHLTWADLSTEASEIRIERRQTGGAFQEIASLAAGAESFTDFGLPGGATFQYRVRAMGIDGASAVSKIVAAATDGSTAPCDGAGALCLDGGRFEATVEGPAADPRLLIDLRDGCGINGHRWLYFATVTDVELTVKVRDTQTGRTWAHFNPAGSVPAPVRDVEAFSCP